MRGRNDDASNARELSGNDAIHRRTRFVETIEGGAGNDDATKLLNESAESAPNEDRDRSSARANQRTNEQDVDDVESRLANANTATYVVYVRG